MVALFACVMWGALQVDSLRTQLSDWSFPYRFGVSKTSHIMVPMRDGVRLRSDVYLPLKGEQFPTVLIRTTYEGFESDVSLFLAQQGYAVVHQHVRGRFGSEGDYRVHAYSGRDGYDTLDWIVRQPWSNGKVGTYGCSFRGENQIILAAENHPAHVALIAEGAGGAIGSAQDSYGYFGVFENGVLNLASAAGWFSVHGRLANLDEAPDTAVAQSLAQHYSALPVAALGEQYIGYRTELDDFFSRKLTDGWWDEQGYISHHDRFSAAALHVNTWFDQTAHDTFRLAEHMRQHAMNERAKQQHVLLGPGQHCQGKNLKSGTISVGQMKFAYTEIDYKQIYLDWFDYWLKDKEVSLPPAYRYFTVHENLWQPSEAWPPLATSERRWFLSEGQLLNEPPADDGVIEYRYDPADPVPTLGGTICCTGNSVVNKAGLVDQRNLLSRKDVVLFKSEPLDADVKVTGNAKVALRVASSATDTDFTVKLVDVYPDGRHFNVHDGVMRMRYREGVARESLIEPGRIYAIELELRPVSYVFKAGHQLALMVSSSNFPRLARNLNTGGVEYQESGYETAVNQIYFGGQHASFLSLPVYRN